MTTLTVLMGPPGAGKSYWTAEHAAGQAVASSEHLRTDRGLSPAGFAAQMAVLRSEAAEALAEGQSVTVDACNTRGEARRRWLDLARQHGAAARLIVCHAPLDELLAVQRDRIVPVAERIVRSYHREFVSALPGLDAEGWDDVLHVYRQATPADVELVGPWITGATP